MRRLFLAFVALSTVLLFPARSDEFPQASSGQGYAKTYVVTSKDGVGPADVDFLVEAVPDGILEVTISHRLVLLDIVDVVHQPLPPIYGNGWILFAAHGGPNHEQLRASATFPNTNLPVLTSGTSTNWSDTWPLAAGGAHFEKVTVGLETSVVAPAWHDAFLGKARFDLAWAHADVGPVSPVAVRYGYQVQMVITVIGR